MTLSPVPPGRFWAKLDDDRTTWHPLVGHSADVAAVLACMLAPGSALRDRLARSAGRQTLSPAERAALVYLAALHDMGKVNHGFQSKALPKEQRRSLPLAGHVKVLLESLDYAPLAEVVLEGLSPLGPDRDAALDLWQAAICHHGRPWSIQTTSRSHALWQPDAVRDPLAELRRLIALARRWSGLEEHGVTSVPPAVPAFTHLFAGLLTLADWIGSTEDAFPLNPAADDDPEGYWEEARSRAGRACAGIGIVPGTTVVSLDGLSLLKQVFPATFGKYEPTALQDRVAVMPIPEPGTRLLIESETGSGKTEAALALYARLRAAGRVGGLAFVLPTRATSKAMYERVRRAIDGMYEPNQRPTLALAMGGEQPWVGSESAELGSEARQYPDDEDRDLGAWATSSSKKFFAAEIVVGTIDQILLAGLPVRHAHLRLAALTRHFIVVDEVHSYDRYMAEVLSTVLDFHSAVGGVSLLMSATLSEVERRRYAGLSDDVPMFDDAIRRAYPVLSICPRPGRQWEDLPLNAVSPSRARAAKMISWQLGDDTEAVATAVNAARDGARVCILRNTVRDARATIAALREAGHEALLWRGPNGRYTPAYHARYTQADRRALDAAVLDRFGRNRDGRDGGVILVATQVVEQSLDVDFDFLVTDLCPIDVLLQRIGRLHRHLERIRPAGYRHAHALVIAPEDGFESYITQRKRPHGWGTVYKGRAGLELTRRVIADVPQIAIPVDNRELIERVYHPDPRDALRAASPAWEEEFLDAEGRDLGREMHARTGVIDFDATYAACSRLFSDAAEREIRTRIGDDRIRIELPYAVPCFHADPAQESAVRHVDLPFHVLGDSIHDVNGDGITEWIEEGDAVRFRVHGKGPIRYDPDGWHWPE